jgi:hypothetical protein
MTQNSKPLSTHGGAQFRATPRFSFAPSQRSNIPNALQPLSTPLVSRYATPSTQGPKLQETIEDVSGGIRSPDLNSHALTGTEEPTRGIEDEGGYELTKLRNRKRRRLSSFSVVDFQSHTTKIENLCEESDPDGDNYLEDTSNPSSPIISPPAAPTLRPTSSMTVPRFILPSAPAPVPPSTPMAARKITYAKPPRFRATEEHEQRQVEPLPEMFSPHRRGQKFLSGGLAAEVIGWLMKLENSFVQHAPTGIGNRQWAVRLVIDEVKGGNNAGMTLVRGRQVHVGIRTEGEMTINVEAMKVILARQESGIGSERFGSLEVGNIVGIKGPIWEVMIEGESWGVGVDWNVLKEDV